MNTSRCVCLTIHNTFFPFLDHDNQAGVQDKVQVVVSSAISIMESIPAIPVRGYRKIIKRMRNETPPTIDEDKLFNICNLAFSNDLKKEKKKTLIRQARDLIKKGVNIHPFLFENEPSKIRWLHEHCIKELLKRAEVSKKGLELINFNIVPPTKDERKLFETCFSAVCKAVYESDKVDKNILIQKARALIKKGVNINPYLFESSAVDWLHEYCIDELLERAEVSKKGLELIDFNKVPPTEDEKKLYQICFSAVCGSKVDEESLIKQARDLIKKGVNIYSCLFGSPVLGWLHEHCVKELHKRAEVSKKGLEAIDFDEAPPTKAEKKLYKICFSAVYGSKVDEESLIKQARGLIKKGVNISSYSFIDTNIISWLKIHCVKELFERAAVNKQGLKRIDFETMLPPNWKPPEWLPAFEKLEGSMLMHRLKFELAKLTEKDDLKRFIRLVGFLAGTQVYHIKSLVSEDWRIKTAISFVAGIASMIALSAITASVRQREVKED